ncbi:helix-turn-helix transcriptional regulator [Fournierella sp.]|uniref:helix-turn-helix domain-containing protein n=1 Tax=Allofournierella sp. TaxID=1940256 RepID=UPI00307A41DF
MSLAKRIAACRKQAGLSQEKLAERMGVSRQTISRWETGEARPDLEKFEQLCGVFSVSADALLFGAQSPAQPDGREQSRRAKAHFRMAAAVVLAAAGVLLFALIESQQPYQTWYTVLGPYASHLFCTWRVWLLMLGIGMAGADGVCIAREYRRL